MIRFTRRIASVSAVKHAGKESFYDFYVIIGNGTKEYTFTAKHKIEGAAVEMRNRSESRLCYRKEMKDIKEAKRYIDAVVNELFKIGYKQLS